MRRTVDTSTELRLSEGAMGVLLGVLASLMVVAVLFVGVTIAQVTAEPAPAQVASAGR